MWLTSEKKENEDCLLGNSLHFLFLEDFLYPLTCASLSGFNIISWNFTFNNIGGVHLDSIGNDNADIPIGKVLRFHISIIYLK